MTIPYPESRSIYCADVAVSGTSQTVLNDAGITLIVLFRLERHFVPLQGLHNYNQRNGELCYEENVRLGARCARHHGL